MPDDDNSTPGQLGTGLTLDAVWLEVALPDLTRELVAAEDIWRRASARDPWGQQSQDAFEGVLKIKCRLWDNILCPRLLTGAVRVSYQPLELTADRLLLPITRCASLCPPMYFGGGVWSVDGNVLLHVLLHLMSPEVERSAGVVDTTVSSEATNQGIEHRLAQGSGEAPPAVVTTLGEATNDQIDTMLRRLWWQRVDQSLGLSREHARQQWRDELAAQSVTSTWGQVHTRYAHPDNHYLRGKPGTGRSR
jgi:hypothetical protein